MKTATKVWESQAIFWDYLLESDLSLLIPTLLNPYKSLDFINL